MGRGFLLSPKPPFLDGQSKKSSFVEKRETVGCATHLPARIPVGLSVNHLFTFNYSTATASAAALATTRSSSTVPPDTPIEPINSPDLFLIGTPPGKVIRPPLECSNPYTGLPGRVMVPRIPDSRANRAEVFA